MDVFVVVGAHGQFGIVGLHLLPGLDLGQHGIIIYVKNSIEISCSCDVGGCGGCWWLRY